MKEYHIPIFVPHKGCPFDCVFCNQKRITGSESEDVSAEDVKRIISGYLRTIKHKERTIEAAFFGGSFTGIPMEIQRELLSAAGEFVKAGDIDGIRLSTRPDYISTEILDQLAEFGTTSIELGVQSMDDTVLSLSGRGHTAADVEAAVSLIKKYPFRLGLQMMTGLPGDTLEKSIYTAKRLIELKPEFVRIYPTLVIKDTVLCDMYSEGAYKPQTLDEAVEWCAELIPLFEENGVSVIRTGLQTTDEICENGAVVAGAYHAAFRELVDGELYFRKINEALKGTSRTRAVIAVNPKEVSKTVGQKRSNIKRIKNTMGIALEIEQDENIQKGKIEVR